MRGIGTAVLMLALTAGIARGEDWPRFRGKGGTGIGNGEAVPTEWSESKNLDWKVKLPGPGSSSPIVVGDKIFVTCWSGYGESRNDPGEMKQLKRHLVCVNKENGKILWTKTVEARLPEDSYSGYLTEHGYASNTPVSDGEMVYAFFGKTGVFAFDMDGNQKWQVGVGQESSNRRWGSAASLILYKDSVIVNASEESQSIRALDKKTGKEIWNTEAGGLELTFGTPVLVTLKDSSQELVIAVPGEIWGLNPDNGKLRWWAEHNFSGNISPSCFASNDIVYVFGGRGGGSMAVRAGGEDDVAKTHVVWKGKETSYVPTPVLYQGHLYWVDDRGIAYCTDAKTGKLKKRLRLSAEGGSFGGRPFYASPVLSDGKLIVVSRNKGTFVFKADPELEQLTVNEFSSDDSQSNATPAITDGHLILRSDQYLYSVSSPRR